MKITIEVKDSIAILIREFLEEAVIFAKMHPVCEDHPQKIQIEEHRKDVKDALSKIYDNLK